MCARSWAGVRSLDIEDVGAPSSSTPLRRSRLPIVSMLQGSGTRRPRLALDADDGDRACADAAADDAGAGGGGSAGAAGTPARRDGAPLARAPVPESDSASRNPNPVTAVDGADDAAAAAVVVVEPPPPAPGMNEDVHGWLAARKVTWRQLRARRKEEKAKACAVHGVCRAVRGAACGL